MGQNGPQAKMDHLGAILVHFGLADAQIQNKEKSVLVNPFSSFTKTTDFFTKILGLKGKGS